MTRRTDRVEDLLRAELSELIVRRVNDPRIRRSTVSSVEVSPDLRHAVVRLSVIGAEPERTAALDAARRARSFLRGALAKRLRRLRVVPELEFRLDRGAELSQRISDLLESVKPNDETP